MKNKTRFNRSANDGEVNLYTKMNNRLIKDNRLSFTQVGIMAYILSQSDKYSINATHLQSISGLGKVRWNNEWKELQEFGYIHKNVIRDKGKILYYEWTVNEHPIRVSPESRKQDSGKQDTNNKQLNNNSIHSNINKLI